MQRIAGPGAKTVRIPYYPSLRQPFAAHPACELTLPQPFARVKEVFEQWSMYYAVVQAGYMYHSELVSTLARWAQQQTSPLRIVDLGCGDAWLATQAFHHANVDAYCGVDVSESAAELAREHSAGVWQQRAMVQTGNLADALRNMADESANTILASYSLHHFDTEAKIALLGECRRVLANEGTLLWIDAVRKNNESHNDYITSLTESMANDWSALTADQREKACAHVRESDFPETSEWMLAHTQAIGLEPSSTLLDREFFRGWTFTKRQGAL